MNAHERAERNANRMRPELALAQIGALHKPLDEEAEIWRDGPGAGTHADRWPECVDCEGHTITMQVCVECGYEHDGDSPVYRGWPCPTLNLVRAALNGSELQGRYVSPDCL